MLEPSLFTFFVVCGGDEGGRKQKTLHSRTIWSAVSFCVETVIFVLFVAALKEAQSIKRWIPRAFGRRFLRADPALCFVVGGGVKRGKK